MTLDESRSLYDRPVHLGLGATVIPQPRFTGPEWYGAYGARNAGDGAEGRLVAMHRFDADWPSWEMHPAGAELVVCVAGFMTVIQELPDGRERRIDLREGDYAINPPGVWHTAQVREEATALFVTSGLGTRHRPR
ncbi:MAG: cupin [Novosphingobium sp.]|nr:cupin [Novosphingobium sp.]